MGRLRGADGRGVRRHVPVVQRPGLRGQHRGPRGRVPRAVLLRAVPPRPRLGERRGSVGGPRGEVVARSRAGRYHGRVKSGTHTFLPTARVHFGAESLEKVEEEARPYGRAFVLTGRTLTEKTDLVRRVEARLGDRHAGTFAGIGQHTPGGTVEEAASLAEGAAADLLVAVGGGSVIDGTKAVARQLGYPQQVAIPTTLSGAEWAQRVGVTDVSEGLKRGFADPKTVPRVVVVLDPEATVFTPEKLWLSTGIRALDH